MLPGGGKVGSSVDDACPWINSSCSEENSAAVAAGTVVPGLLPATDVKLVLVDDGVAMEELVAHQ